MPIQSVSVKRGGAYEDQVLAGAFIKVSGAYLPWDEPTVAIKADGAYSLGNGVRPTNVTPPSLVAPAGSDVGDTISILPGTWDGNPPPNITNRWYADGLPILGETGPIHIVTPQDAGHTITAEERATNTLGTATAQAPESFPVPALTGFSSGFSSGFGA